MTTVLLSKSTNTFCRDLDERIVGHLNLTFGSSRIASSAYQKWPTKNTCHLIIGRDHLSIADLLTYLKFENR